jgi:diacylglycerol kinase family enzyme
MNVLVIHNLGSGYGEGAIYDFIRTYSVDGDSVTIRFFNGKTPFSELLKDAKEYDFVVACGGDGTIATVSYELRNTNIPILPFPAGTANLLAMNLLSPSEPHALSKLADQANTLLFDIGEIECENKKVGFTMMAGCGYDQLIMSNASSKKRFLGPIAYFEAALTNPAPQVSEFKITIDGKTINSSGIGVVLTNFSKIQFDLMVSDKNLPRDGLLDLVVLKTKNAVELLPTVFAKAVDHSGDLAKKIGAVEIYRGKEITIEADPAMLLEYDGEATELSTPFTARCLPEAVRFIVSEECLKLFADKEKDQQES